METPNEGDSLSTSTHSVLHVDVLGPLAVRVDGQDIHIGGPRQRAVLAALALQGNRTIPADRLIDTVWGDDPPASARSTLQAYVSRLRKSLSPCGSDLIERDAVGYALRLPPGALDIDRLRALAEDGRRAMLTGVPALAASRFAEAVEQGRGDPLADLLQYEFAQVEQRRLSEEMRTVVGEWIDAELASGNHKNMVPELERLIDAEPFHEPYWERLMLALYGCGRQADALAAFQSARRVLADELGIEPGPRLVAAEAAILRQDASISPEVDNDNLPYGRGQSLGRRSDLGLVGRDAALADIDRRLTIIEQGGGVLVVSGAAGIGKTALLTAASEHASALGTVVLNGRGWEDDGAPPFWPWIEALRDLAATVGHDKMVALTEAHRPQLAPLLPELGAADDSTLTTSAPLAQFAVYEAVTAVLLAASADRSIVVVLDDLHWADAATIELLRHLAPRATKSPLLVLAGRRNPTPLDAPIQRALEAFEASEGVSDIRLDRLSDADILRLVERTAPDGSEAAVLEEVVHRSDGVPLFALELAREASSASEAIPDSITTAIRRRVDAIEPTATDFLQIAALAGEEFSIQIVGRAAELTGTDLLASVEVGMAAGLIVAVPERTAWYRFNHALVREALIDGLTPSRRATLHGRLAAALTELARPGSAEYVTERVHHALEAAIASPDPNVIDLAIEAADYAVRSAGYDDAVSWLDRAESVASACGDKHRWAEVLLRRGDVENQAGWAAQAHATHLAAADIARELNDGALMARAAVGYAYSRIDIQTVDEIHLGLCAEADRMLDPEDSVERALLLASWGPGHYWSDSDLSRSLIDQAIEMARRLDDPRVLGASLLASGWTVAGGPEVRIDLGQEILEIGRRSRDTELELWGHRWTYVGIFDVEGQSQRSRAALVNYADRAEQAKQPQHQWFSQMFLANEWMRLGDIAAAEPLIESAFVHGQVCEPISATYYYGAQLFNLRWLQGRIHELTPLAEATVAQVPNIHTWRALLAYIYACAGDAAAAGTLLRELRAAGWDEIGSGGTVIMSQTLAAESAVLAGEVELGTELVEHMAAHQERYVHMATVTTMGNAAFFHGRILNLIGDLEGAIERVRVALERDELGRLRPLVVRDQLVLADYLDKRGGPGDDAEAADLRQAAALAIDGETAGCFNYL